MLDGVDPLLERRARLERHLLARVPKSAQAMVAATDHGLVVGDGVFESLKIVSRAPFAVRRHTAFGGRS